MEAASGETGALSNDPRENYNLWTTTMTMAWVFQPAIRSILEFEKSATECPNNKPGEDFKGYPKKK